MANTAADSLGVGMHGIGLDAQAGLEQTLYHVDGFPNAGRNETPERRDVVVDVHWQSDVNEGRMAAAATVASARRPGIRGRPGAAAHDELAKVHTQRAAAEPGLCRRDCRAGGEPVRHWPGSAGVGWRRASPAIDHVVKRAGWGLTRRLLLR